MKLERRAFALDEITVERRADDGSTPTKIRGHAAVFNQLSEPLWEGFREKIQPGAFRKTIKEADVRALFNHDPNFVLGRTKSKTLSLREDDVGLWFEVEPPETNWANDLMVSIERGDIDQASFGFRVVRDKMHTEAGNGTGTTVRELLEVELFDVSPVTFPAYPQTDVSARTLVDCGIEWERLASVVLRSRAGIALTQQEAAVLQESIDLLRNFVPSAPGQEPCPERDLRFKRMERELELIEAS